jgi:hypothetical protein
MVASYFGLPVAVGWLVFGVVSTLLAGIYFAAFSAWVAWVARARSAGALSVAAAWIVCELGRASLIVGNPWAMLGYSQIDHLALIQVADLGGPYLPTFLIAAVNAAIASLFARDLGGRWPRASAVAVALLLLSTLGYGAIRLRAPLAGEASIAAAVVQSGHGRGFGWRPEYRREGLEDYLALTRGATAFSPTLVVWPENAVSFYLQEETPERDELLAVARELGVELVVGGPSYRNSEDGVRYRNSVYLVRSGRLAGRYDKLRLVPLAEADTLGALWPREQAYEPGHGRRRCARRSVSSGPSSASRRCTPSSSAASPRAGLACSSTSRTTIGSGTRPRRAITSTSRACAPWRAVAGCCARRRPATRRSSIPGGAWSRRAASASRRS